MKHTDVEILNVARLMSTVREGCVRDFNGRKFSEAFWHKIPDKLLKIMLMCLTKDAAFGTLFDSPSLCEAVFCILVHLVYHYHSLFYIYTHYAA